jgi:hypothetical protein
LSAWRVTVRIGPKVEHVPAATLEEALDALEFHTRAAATSERRAPVDARIRRYEPADQVAARVELRGPGHVRAGFDVRGDGTVEAWTGRVRRARVEPQDGDSPYEALRKTLQSTSVEP